MLFGRTKPPVNRADLGRWGEAWTRRYLRRQGWSFVAQNVACRGGEIDLIMGDPEGALVFIEVKTRISEDFQPVESVITYAKKRRMRSAARFFLTNHDPGERPLRFDVVVVIPQQRGKPEFRHYPGAFRLDC